MRFIVTLLLLFIVNIYADEISLKVGTLNVWQKLKITNPKQAKLRQRFLCEQIQKNLNDLDVLGIQELWSRQRYKKVLKCIRKSKTKIYYAKSKRSTSFLFWKRDGLLLLSKYPIKRSYFYNYRYMEKKLKKQVKFQKDLSEVFVNKGFQLVKISVPTSEGKRKEVHIYNTHLAANFGTKKSGKENTQSVLRKAQLRYLVSNVKRLSKNVPTFLIGDFNYALNGLKERSSDIEPGSTLHNYVFDKLGFIEAKNYKKDDPRSFHTYAKSNYYNESDLGQLDHVYCGILSNNDKVTLDEHELIFTEKKGRYNVSDHYGMSSRCIFYF